MPRFKESGGLFFVNRFKRSWLTKNERGYSLLELVVALGIVAITSGVVMTHWAAPSRERHQLMQSAQMLASSIRYAQQMSVQGVPTWAVMTRQGVEIRTQQGTAEFRYLESWPWADGIFVNNSNAPDFRFEFTNRGTLAGAASRTQLRSPNYRVDITTTIGGGRVQIHDIIRLY